MATEPLDGDALERSAARRCPHCADGHPPDYTHCPKTGRSLRAGANLVGTTLDKRYRVLAVVGEGGMGTVYEAEDVDTHRRVAVKRLHPELAGDVRAHQRFLREARAAAATGHPHIVEVVHSGVSEDGAPYLAMEFLRGQSLAKRLRSEGPMAVDRALRMVRQILEALRAVHAQGIVHRDLKPDNVFLIRKGTEDFVKIVDFGISKMASDDTDGHDLTRTGVTMGTPYYMSPEQARGVRRLDARTDLYCVSVLLYEALTGKLPFLGDNYHALLQAILRGDPVPPAQLVTSIPRAVSDAVLKGLARDVTARYQTAEEMLGVIEDLRLRLGEARSLGGTSDRSVESPIRGPAAQAKYFYASSPDFRDSTAPRRSPATAARPLHEALESRSRSADTVRDALRVRPEVRTDARPETRRSSVSRLVAVRSDGGTVKGALVVAQLEAVAQAASLPVPSIVAALPAAARESIDGVVLPLAWLPLSTFVALIELPRPGTTAPIAPPSISARACADRESTTTHRVFFSAPSPLLLVDRVATMQRQYFSGDFQVIRGALDLRIRLDPALEQSVLLTWLAAFWGRMFELTGASDVRASVVRVDERMAIAIRCRELGDVAP